MGVVQGSHVNVFAGSVTPAAVVQAAEWRFLVRALYLGAGSPLIPGFTEAQVDQMLWGELPADAEFFAAMLRVLSSPRAVPGRDGDLDEQHRDALDSATESFRKLLGAMQDESGNVFTAYSSALAPPSPSRATASRGVRLSANNARVIVLQPPPSRGFTPPNPDTFTTVAEFVTGMDDLRTWARMSLRGVEEKSAKLAGNDELMIWLPRSTLSDVLKRHDKLPRIEVVRSYVAACGLPPTACTSWLTAYRQLESARAIELAHRAA
jgi:hypothetical protein